MRLRLVGLVVALSISILSQPLVLAATEPKERGLLITPTRSYLTMDAGDQKTRSFTVANLTNKTLDVTLTVQAFTVADYAYDFTFDNPTNNWIQLVENHITLKSFESHPVPYKITLPKDASPGGHYYTLFANTNLSTQGSIGNVRVSSLLYLTVTGKLIQTNQIVGSSMPRIILSNEIPYTLDVKNTGNVHYFANFSGSVNGLFYSSGTNGASQLLMPGTTRRIAGIIRSPILPGIYKAHYGYTPDNGQRVERSQYIVVVPPWSLALLAIIGFVIYKVTRRRSHRTTKKASTDS